MAKLLQMIVALGIMPNLIPGVGLPAEKRSPALQALLEQDTKRGSQPDPDEVTH